MLNDGSLISHNQKRYIMLSDLRSSLSSLDRDY